MQTTNIETTPMDMSTESVVTTTLIETTTEKPTSDLHTTTDSVVMPTLTETTTMKPTTDLDTTDNVDMTTLSETATMKPTTDLYATTDSVAITRFSPTSTVDTRADVDTTESVVMTTFSETSPVETNSDTTEITQSVSFTSTTSDNPQQCHCPCSSVNIIDLNEKELLQKIQQLKIDMTVVTKETNKYKRSLLSSSDNRVSSKVIGWIGISVLICVLLVIVLLDIGHLLRFISRFQTVFRN